jgi:nucleoid-associated protein YgaU
MKRRYLIAALLALLGTTGLAAQSLENNEYYRKSVEFANLSQKALEEGSYTESAEYARQSQEYAALSKKYIEEMLLAYRARSALAEAKTRMDQAARAGLRSRAAAVYDEAAQYFRSAETQFNGKKYEPSIPDSKRVVELLRDFETLYPASSPQKAEGPVSEGLAAFYEVKLKVQQRDCLWRIAEFDFVYGDPLQWPRLYEANRESFPDPNNPNLIVPGMVLRIPPIRGEARSGTK